VAPHPVSAHLQDAQSKPVGTALMRPELPPAAVVEGQVPTPSSLAPWLCLELWETAVLASCVSVYNSLILRAGGLAAPNHILHAVSPGELGIPKNRSGRDSSYSTPHLMIPPCDSKTGWMTQPATQALCCPWESGHGLGPLCRTGCVGVCPGADIYTAVSPSTVRCERPQMLHKPQESR
jgi:hypothetical protein